MKSGRFIGVMSGTSLDGVDVVLAAIDERMVAQQASYTHPIPLQLEKRHPWYVSGAVHDLVSSGKT